MRFANSSLAVSLCRFLQELLVGLLRMVGLSGAVEVFSLRNLRGECTQRRGRRGSRNFLAHSHWEPIEPIPNKIDEIAFQRRF
jgi:hypothetical protein